MNKPSQGLKFGLSIILAVTLFGLGAGVIASRQEDVRHELEMREYRQFSQYNGKILPVSDVIATIMLCRGNPPVQVLQKDGSDFIWTAEQLAHADTFYSQSSLSATLPLGAEFRCTIGKDGNGAVEKIIFEEV